MTLATTSDGIDLAFEVAGRSGGPCVVLLHGAAIDNHGNWKATGWWDALVDDFLVIGIDQRGHGASARPSTSAGWRADRFAADVVEVMDAAGVERAALLGYSAGSGVALRVASMVPHRVSCVASGGTGVGALAMAGLDAPLGADATRQALQRLTEYLRRIDKTNGVAAAAMIAAQVTETRATMVDAGAPILFWVGRDDTGQGPFAALSVTEHYAAATPGSERRVFDGDHLTVLNNEECRASVAGWLMVTGVDIGVTASPSSKHRHRPMVRPT